MTDSPDQPPKPHPERTAQLAALVEDVPEDDVHAGAEGEGASDEGAEGDVPEGDDGAYVPPESQIPLVSRPPPLLPKEKTQVRNRAFLIGGIVFVVCVALALGVVFAFGHGTQPVARPAPPPRPQQPQPVAATPRPHTHITLDEIVFTSDGGTAPP